MTKLFGYGCALVCATFLVSTHIALAAPSIDQSYVIGALNPETNVSRQTNVAYLGPLSSFTQAQTFTVGVSGELTGVDLQLGRIFASPGVFTVSIESVANGLPSGTSLAQTVGYASSLTAWDSSVVSPFTSFDFTSANLSVYAGEVLAIVLTAVDAGVGVGWDTYFQGGYAAGAFYSSDSGGPFKQYPMVGINNASLTADAGFRTFVDSDPTQPVPEPGSALMLQCCSQAQRRSRQPGVVSGKGGTAPSGSCRRLSHRPKIAASAWALPSLNTMGTATERLDPRAARSVALESGLHERTAAFAQRTPRVLRRDGCQVLAKVVGVLRFRRRLDLP